MATPSPTPYSTEKYEVSEGAEYFHNLPGRPDNDFSTEGKYYMYAAIFAGLPMTLFVLGMCGYYIFLCVRSGCCSAFCNSICCCKGLVARIICCCNICGWKDCCCADTSHENKVKKTCFCYFNKNSEACCHNGLLTKRDDSKRPWMRIRLVLVAIFIVGFGLNFGVIDGKRHLEKAVKLLGGALQDLGDVFDDIATYAEDLADSGSSMKSDGSTLKSTCSASTSSVGGMFVSYGTAIETAGDAMSSSLGSLPDRFQKLGKSVEKNGLAALSYSQGGAFLLLGTIFGALGIVASLMYEGKWFCFRFSSNLLACSSIIGIFVMFMLTFAVTIELLIGQVVGDFCYEGPGQSIGELAVGSFNSSNPFFGKVLTYYSSCQGSNPFSEHYNSAKEQAEFAATAVTTYSGVITADSSCTQSAFSDIQVQSNLLAASDSSDPLYNLYNAIGCAAVNPIFAKTLDKALCGSFIDGFYNLFGFHSSLCVYTYIALFLISFLRWDLQNKESHGHTVEGSTFSDTVVDAHKVEGGEAVKEQPADEGVKMVEVREGNY